MKRKITGLFLLSGLLAASVVTAHAETYQGKPDWRVAFTSEQKMESNFTTQDLSDEVANLQPGDSIHLSVGITNEYGGVTEWYMKNAIRESLEDASAAASGGAYSYILTYTDPKGRATELFNSDTVGGEGESGAGEGLNQATSALKDYFYLDDLKKGEAGKVDLEVALEGETQGNDYQDTLAELEMAFATELDETDQPYVEEPNDSQEPETETSTTEEPENNPDTEEEADSNPGTDSNTDTDSDSGSKRTRVHSVKTGDVQMTKLYIALMAAGFVLLFLGIWNYRSNRKERKGAAR